MAPLDLSTITHAIVEQKAAWTAAPTPLLDLPDEDLKSRLGVVIDKPRLQELVEQPDPDIAEIIAHFESSRQSPSTAEASSPPAERPATPKDVSSSAVELVRERLKAVPGPHPAFPWWWFDVDWRNRKGRDNVTPVTDQGGCGSCVAFGTTAALESMVLVEHNVGLDLSEAELLFCGGGSCGGWWPDSAIAYVKSKGVALESCFPYQPHNMPCMTCSERDCEAIQALDSVVLNNVAQRKQYLWGIGPMICVFAVYSDFFGYHGGVYSHVTGGLAGYHCVEVIGYNDIFKYWICKNSWGTGWGEGGFFRIAYGQCGIDSQFPFWGIYGTKWFRP
jgi:hypothetical protein